MKRRGFLESVADEWEGEKFGQEVLGALVMLDSLERDAIIYHDIYGKSYLRTAWELGTPYWITKQVVQQGRVALHAALFEY